MSRKLLRNIVCGFIAMSVLAGCGASTGNTNKSDLQVGLVTNIGSIDDKSFNQGSWEGIQSAAQKFGIKSKYLQPGGESDAEILKEIANFDEAGYDMVVAPGFKFTQSITQAQSKYPDKKFMIIDAVPETVGNNTVAVLFDEHEAGFLAGLATAVELKEANVGFIGGMATDAVNRYNWGFQQGIQFANENYGTSMTMLPENFIYQGTFTDVAAGQQISAQLYDRGVNVIFSAAGAVGTGVIKEARERAQGGEKVWVVGVDVDQYDDGLYNDTQSVVLTSAMKKISTATYDVIADAIEGAYKGGQTLTYGVQNDGVGIPEVNPNLNEETTKVVNEAYAKIKAGEIIVVADQGIL
ncbi:BMP family lipoprotein [Cellulosilyticum ruminicola]|uniref:BMP family lipoprotein n=1 Tax=Cellulosilyticum ruminicola TaxID=425254 RepID=UPI0006D09429|nr:BMP family ABC transporter substrate-binding protein [Cellulosilyticum ruminicola]